MHALGYVAAISGQEPKRIDSDSCAGTSLVGRLGVEGAYENGKRGGSTAAPIARKIFDAFLLPDQSHSAT